MEYLQAVSLCRDRAGDEGESELAEGGHSLWGKLLAA